MKQDINFSKTFERDVVNENGKKYKVHYQTIKIYNDELDNLWLQLKERVSAFSQFDWDTMYEVWINCMLKNVKDIEKIKDIIEQSVDPAFNNGTIGIEIPLVEGKYFGREINEGKDINSLKVQADSHGVSFLPISKDGFYQPNPIISYSTKDTFYCNFLSDDIKNYEELVDFLKNILQYLGFENISEKNLSEVDFWSMIHESIIDVAKDKFEHGFYADAVESAFKEINTQVKKIVMAKTGEELDGASLMYKALSERDPIIVLDVLSSETGRNIQKGYMQIFAGAMTGIRNPKAHENITIGRERAIHFIFLASLLMYKLDEAIR